MRLGFQLLPQDRKYHRILSGPPLQFARIEAFTAIHVGGRLLPASLPPCTAQWRRRTIFYDGQKSTVNIAFQSADLLEIYARISQE